MLRIIPTLVLVSLPFALAAQAPGALHGIVVSDSGTPIPSARVTILPSGRSLTTNRIGRFILTLPPGQYRLNASYPGYRPGTVLITIRSGDSTEVTVRLEVQAAQLEEVVVRDSGSPPR